MAVTYISEHNLRLLSELRIRGGYRSKAAVISDALSVLARDMDVLSPKKVPVTDDPVISGEENGDE